MSSYVFQFFCRDGKVGTRGSDQQGRDMLSLPAPSHLAPPPRPRPSTAPTRLPPPSGEHNTRERRRSEPAQTQAQIGPISPSNTQESNSCSKTSGTNGTQSPAAPVPQFSATTASFTSRALHASSSASSYGSSARMVFNAYAMASCVFSTASTIAAV